MSGADAAALFAAALVARILEDWVRLRRARRRVERSLGPDEQLERFEDAGHHYTAFISTRRSDDEVGA